jgi:hypothetical protein
MISAAHGRIAAGAQYERDGCELSWMVFRQLLGPDFDHGKEEWDGQLLGTNILVDELVEEYPDGASAALAYRVDSGDDDVVALIAWMKAGAYKGCFADAAEFCRDQFADAIADHMELWTNSNEVGFPPGVDWGEAIDWESIADQTEEAETRGDDGAVFHFIPNETGSVYVFDMSIAFGQETS